MASMKKFKRRTEILAAALEIIAERGYYGTGMQDIAEAVGIRASSLYNHFSSKHEILATIMTTAMSDLLNQHARAIIGTHTPAEKLSATMAVHLQFHAERRLEIRVTNREISTLKEPERTLLTQLRRDYVNRWIRIIEDGIKTGDFSCPDPKIASYALVDMGMGVANWYRPDGPRSLSELQKSYCLMALQAVGVTEN